MKVTKVTTLKDILTATFGEEYNNGDIGDQYSGIHGISFRFIHANTYSLARVGAIIGVQLTGYNPSYRGRAPMLRVMVVDEELDTNLIHSKYLELQEKRKQLLAKQKAVRKEIQEKRDNLSELCQKYGLTIGSLAQSYGGFILTLRGLTSEQLESIGKAVAKQ